MGTDFEVRTPWGRVLAISLAEPIGLAVAARQEVDERFVGQCLDGAPIGRRKDRITLAAVADRGVGPKDEVLRQRRGACTCCRPCRDR